MKRPNLFDGMLIAGVLAVVCGVAMVSIPASFIVAGGLTIWLAFLGLRANP